MFVLDRTNPYFTACRGTFVRTRVVSEDEVVFKGDTLRPLIGARCLRRGDLCATSHLAAGCTSLVVHVHFRIKTLRTYTQSRTLNAVFTGKCQAMTELRVPPANAVRILIRHPIPW